MGEIRGRRVGGTWLRLGVDVRLHAPGMDCAIAYSVLVI